MSPSRVAPRNPRVPWELKAASSAFGSDGWLPKKMEIIIIIKKHYEDNSRNYLKRLFHPPSPVVCLCFFGVCLKYVNRFSLTFIRHDVKENNSQPYISSERGSLCKDLGLEVHASKPQM